MRNSLFSDSSKVELQSNLIRLWLRNAVKVLTDEVNEAAVLEQTYGIQMYLPYVRVYHEDSKENIEVSLWYQEVQVVLSIPVPSEFKGYAFVNGEVFLDYEDRIVSLRLDDPGAFMTEKDIEMLCKELNSIHYDDDYDFSFPMAAFPELFD